jgi:ketosteroid isomerase-like protein
VAISAVGGAKASSTTTFKPTGRRSSMTEMALYTVEDGKILQEQFFYNAPGA